jgi:hypothetical protein
VSSSSLLPGAGAGTGGISDVVSQDDLTRFAQIAGVLRYLTAPLEPPPAPTSPSPVAPSVAASSFLNTYAMLSSSGVDTGPAVWNAAKYASHSGNVGGWTAFFVWLVTEAALPILKFVLQVVDGVRKGIDPGVGTLAVTVMNEFLGTEFTAANLPLGLSTGDHITRARSTGALLYNQLEREFVLAGAGKVIPSIAPAQTFSGLAVNFGLANGIMGLIGGMVPEVHLEELRELGEEVAQNVGLGRLVRRALTPLINTLVSQPAQWALNTKYTPTQFKEHDLVNPYLATSLPHEQLYPAMHLLGYSDDKIAAFIEMHEKKLTPRDVQTLINWGFWSADDGHKYIQRQGWPAGFAGNVLLLEGFHEVRPWINKEVDVLLSEVSAGQITVSEFAQVIDGFALSAPEKDVIVALANYRAGKSHITKKERLSGGELFYAFAAGLLTDSEVRDHWTARGLPVDDQDIRMHLWLLHLNRLHELEQAKLKAYQQKQQAFLEKQAGTKAGPLPPQPPIPPFPLG